MLGAVPLSLTFCGKCHGLSGCLLEHWGLLDCRRTETPEPSWQQAVNPAGLDPVPCPSIWWWCYPMFGLALLYLWSSVTNLGKDINQKHTNPRETLLWAFKMQTVPWHKGAVWVINPVMYWGYFPQWQNLRKHSERDRHPPHCCSPVPQIYDDFPFPSCLVISSHCESGRVRHCLKGCHFCILDALEQFGRTRCVHGAARETLQRQGRVRALWRQLGSLSEMERSVGEIMVKKWGVSGLY